MRLAIATEENRRVWERDPILTAPEDVATVEGAPGWIVAQKSPEAWAELADILHKRRTAYSLRVAREIRAVLATVILRGIPIDGCETLYPED